MAPAATSGGASERPSKSAAVWMRPSQLTLASVIAQRTGLRVAGVGLDLGGRRTSAGEHPAAVFEARAVDDLRGVLQFDGADVALVLSADTPHDHDALDNCDLVRRAADAGRRIITLEPSPSSLNALVREGRSSGADAWPQQAPLFRRSPGFRAASEVFESFGRVRCVSFAARASRDEGTLAARLFDAMDSILAILGEPESIDASVQGPRSTSGVHLAPSETLAGLVGDLTANLRFAGQRSAAVTLTDMGGRWFRGMTILGDSGCLRFDERRFEWTDESGETIDSSYASPGQRTADRTARASSASTGAGVIADDIAFLIDASPTPISPLDRTRALAMAEAAVLSARTAQPESPATLLRMAGAV